MTARGVIHEPNTAPIAPHSCSSTSCGNGSAVVLLDDLLIGLDQTAQVVGAEFGVEVVAMLPLDLVQLVLEQVVVDAEHHVAVHLDEAAVAVVGEAGIAGALRQPFDRAIVEAEIEHGVHHARHRDRRARAHRDQQRPLGIAEAGVGRFLDVAQGRATCCARSVGIAPVVVVVEAADLGRDGEARRHRQPQTAHLGEVRALAAEQVAHLRACHPARPAPKPYTHVLIVMPPDGRPVQPGRCPRSRRSRRPRPAPSGSGRAGRAGSRAARGSSALTVTRSKNASTG